MMRLFLFAFLLIGGPARCQSFFVDPQCSGATTSRLVPIESTPAGKPVRVSFGVPFPKGFLPESGLDTLRILDEHQVELPIATKVLSPWRNLGTGASEDSIRSALVQVEVTFGDADRDGRPDPLALTVEWGRTTRQLKPLTASLVRDDWVLVDDSRYPASEKVYEPRAFMEFTAEWFGQCLLKSRLLPFHSHPDFATYDTVFPLFGDTMVGRVDPRVTSRNQVDYLHDYEPWLFDRAMTLYQLAFRSADATFLREAHRATQCYAGHINNEGWFELRGDPDLKYNYGESLAADYWLTGDESHLATIARMRPMFDDFKITYSVESNFWTERHAAYKLLGYVTSFELLGDPELATAARDSFTALAKMQDHPVPGASDTGGLMHTSESHGEGGAEFIASPWMSALLADAVERYYIHSGDTRVKHFITRLAEFVEQSGSSIYQTSTEFADVSAVPFTLPFYLAGPRLTPEEHEQNEYDDFEHAVDVGKILALGYYFSRIDGAPNVGFLDTLSRLLRTQNELTFPNWIRPGGPDSGKSVFRLSPPRKFNWWFRTTSDMDWLVGPVRLGSGTGNSAATIELSLAADRDEALPGDAIHYSLTYRNTGTADAHGVCVRSELYRNNPYADPDLVLDERSISDGGKLTTPEIVWHVGTVEAGAPPKTLSFQVTVANDPVPPTRDRPLAPFLGRARVGYCSQTDPASDCFLPDDFYAEGRYTHSGLSPMIVTTRPIDSLPPRRDIVPPCGPDPLDFLGGAAGEIRLNWVPTTEFDVAGYRVYRSLTESGPFELQTPALLKGTRFTQTGLPNGVPYYYQVRAVDFAGNQTDDNNHSICANNPIVIAAAYDHLPVPRLHIDLIDGDAHISINGGIGWNYTLQYSVDLENWGDYTDLRTDVNGRAEYVDTYEPRYVPSTFWRAVLILPP